MVSVFAIFAVDAAALIGAWLSLLEALTVVLGALRLRALAPLLHHYLLQVLCRVEVVAVDALTVTPAHLPPRKALAVP